MDDEYNICWPLQKLFNRIGYKIFMLCLWLIRLNGGLPYTWHYENAAGDKKIGLWGPDVRSNKLPCVLVRKPFLVAWSSINAFIVCATFIGYIVSILMPMFEEFRSTAQTAMLLKNLVEFVVAMGLICHLRMKEALLARLLCKLYGVVETIDVPYTMKRSWMQVASVLILKASLISAFVFLAQDYPLQDSMLSKAHVVYMFILRMVINASVLPVLLLLHYVTVLTALQYNEVSRRFQTHAFDLVPARATEAMMVIEKHADKPSDDQRAQQLNPVNKAKTIPSYFPKTSLESIIMRIADTNIYLVYNLQHLQRLINEYFSVPVLLVMARSITNLVFLFFLVVMKSEEDRSPSIATLALQEAASIVLMCQSSEVVSRQKRKLKSILCCLKVFCSDFLQDKLGRFLELMSDDPEFNVSGYFMLAKNCLIPILSFIATYLVILLQFYASESGCRGNVTFYATNGTNFTDAADTDSLSG